MDRQKWLEWTGVGTAILYSMLIALNIGAEFIGFLLLFLSAGLIGLWASFWQASWHHASSAILRYSRANWHVSLVLIE